MERLKSFCKFGTLFVGRNERWNTHLRSKKNKTEARARGRLYIRQWQLPNGKIEYIRELAEGEEAVKFGRAAGY